MERLSALDLGFILLERRTQPLHVAYLNIHTLPEGAPPDFVRKLADRLRAYGVAQPPFNRRLERRRSGMYWVADDDFDIEHHVVHIALPKPARARELMAMVSRVHASHLDRKYPLWRTYLIEGFEDGRIATYSKLHHSVADGIAATRLMMKSMSSDPDVQLPSVWALPPRQFRRRGSIIPNPVGKIAQGLSMVGQLVGSAPAIARELKLSYQEFRGKHPDFVSGFDTPASILNQPITASRRYVAGSYALQRVKALGKALGGTTNDVVLAMCSAALRRYLMDLSALPDKPLIAAVPVSMRRDGSENGNNIVFLLANLATHLADPLQRIDLIKRSVEHTKQRYLRMKPAEVFGYNLAMLAPAALNMVTGINPRWQAFNLVISNTPGPRTALYWQGCRLDNMYPVSVLLDGQALNISLTRTAATLDFGILACRRTLPKIQRLLDYLELGLKELEYAVFGASCHRSLQQESRDLIDPVESIIRPRMARAG